MDDNKGYPYFRKCPNNHGKKQGRQGFWAWKHVFLHMNSWFWSKQELDFHHFKARKIGFQPWNMAWKPLKKRGVIPWRPFACSVRQRHRFRGRAHTGAQWPGGQGWWHRLFIVDEWPPEVYFGKAIHHGNLTVHPGKLPFLWMICLLLLPKGKNQWPFLC